MIHSLESKALFFVLLLNKPLTVLGGVAQFEREMMLERQLENIAKAQAAGKYRGRKPIAMERQAEVCRLAAIGMAKVHIALELKIGEATVYRILARDREQAHPASSA
jgi:DNA invertase Pin-like site-specific DNA recombinase